MTATEAKAIRIRQMLNEAEVLSLEWRRLGKKFAPPRTRRCLHCAGSGWVQMTALSDFDEEETYQVLCRRCSA